MGSPCGGMLHYRECQSKEAAGASLAAAITARNTHRF